MCSVNSHSHPTCGTQCLLVPIVTVLVAYTTVDLRLGTSARFIAYFVSDLQGGHRRLGHPLAGTDVSIAVMVLIEFPLLFIFHPNFDWRANSRDHIGLLFPNHAFSRCLWDVNKMLQRQNSHLRVASFGLSKFPARHPVNRAAPDLHSSLSRRRFPCLQFARTVESHISHPITV